MGESSNCGHNSKREGRTKCSTGEKKKQRVMLGRPEEHQIDNQKKINVNYGEERGDQFLRGRVTNFWEGRKKEIEGPGHRRAKEKKKQKQTEKRKTENKKSPGHPCPQQKAKNSTKKKKVRRRSPTPSWRKGARR